MEEEEAAQVHLLTDTKMLQTLCTLVLDAEWLEFHLDLTDTENWGEFWLLEEKIQVSIFLFWF